MSRGTTCVAVVVASATALLAQQAPQSPTFRAGTALVRVDVTVLDAAGKPVPGLTAGDFDVTLDGRSQPVQTVDYQTTPTGQTVKAVSGRQAVARPRSAICAVSAPTTSHRSRDRSRR